MRATLIWTALAAAIIAPVAAAAFSPQLQWRDGIYIASGFAGVVGMALLLVQPLLAAGDLPLSQSDARRVHRVTGTLLLGAVLLHVAGLWITSPPDVVDALTFTSPTPFSVWGVIAMWGVFATALLAAWRRRLPLRPMTWRRVHLVLGLVIAAGTVTHALLIEGTMEVVTKWLLAGFVLVATLRVVWRAGRFRDFARRSG
ncbi:ferric reductase-like transmembrane domain-containing protein [uncultured Tateyamaria sp.]|uniref:ferric reductase-like transmembrane domain-containing protein n=1 Tax=uncultured Tateyamaria sp. TaxID=455651 RepID=UPI002616B863|nr:ferric reductase-like transmembrane domain-containing protein [uncultured Tateyamaria sp.]